MHDVVTANADRILFCRLNRDCPLEFLQTVDEPMRRDSEHLLCRRPVLGPQNRAVWVRILVEQPLDAVGQVLERARERKEVGRRIENTNETGIEDLLQFLLRVEELAGVSAM